MTPEPGQPRILVTGRPDAPTLRRALTHAWRTHGRPITVVHASHPDAAAWATEHKHCGIRDEPWPTDWDLTPTALHNALITAILSFGRGPTPAPSTAPHSAPASPSTPTHPTTPTPPRTPRPRCRRKTTRGSPRSPPSSPPSATAGAPARRPDRPARTDTWISASSAGSITSGAPPIDRTGLRAVAGRRTARRSARSTGRSCRGCARRRPARRSRRRLVRRRGGSSMPRR